MHGFSLMTMVLTDLADDVLLVSTALEAMYQWKLQEKNKVEDCGIQEPVQRLADSSDPRISGPARKLLQYWSTLVTSYRIARKPKIASLDAEDEATTTTIAEAESAQPSSAMDHRRPAHSEYDNVFAPKFTVAPVRRGPPMPAFARPRPPPPPPQSIRTPSNSAVAERSRLDAIIALAQQNASTPTATPGQRGITNSPSASSPQGSRSSMPSPAPRPVEEIWEEEERRKKQEKERERERRKKQKLQSSSTSSSSERDDKRAKKLIGDIVVPTMSKYKQKVDRDQFKRFAQQCTELLLEKEKKGKHYSQFCRMTTVPDEKRKKIQAFSEDYTIRLIAKIEAKGKSRESRKDSTDAVKVNGNGNSSHDASTTPGDSCVVATPEMPGSSSQTPGHVDPDDNYGESDLEMDLDMDAELEDHTFSVVRDKSAQ
jgi:histone-lysine N-methyltransferase SETD2